MSRIRSVKPDYWSSPQVMRCSPLTRLMFIGIWNFCDDAGRMPADVVGIKAKIFPADPLTPEQTTGLLRELSGNGLVALYTAEGIEYLQVTGWRHQRIEKPQPLKYPAPQPTDLLAQNEAVPEHSRSTPGVVRPDRIGEDRIGEDRRGVQRGTDADRTRAKKRAHAPAQKTKRQPRQEAKRSPRAPMPESWVPNEAGTKYATELGIPSARVPYLTRRCRDYHIRNGTMIAGDRGLAATWRTWIDNEVKFAAEKNGEVVDLEPRSEITKGMTPEQKKAYVDEEMRKFREANRVG